MFHLRSFYVLMVVGALGIAAGSASGTTLYSQDFEANTDGWFDYGGTLTRVPTSTGGITSAGGGYHAVVTGAYTAWGGYNFGAGSVPTTFQPYRTALDIYLDTTLTAPDDSRFDYSSAISDSDGQHRRDFVMTGGFYVDGQTQETSFIFSASNNTPGWPKNPNSDPYQIATSGWYTIEHTYYDNGGVLAVDMSIGVSGGATLHTWTLSNASDDISLIGGNRYGWMLNIDSDLGGLAIDNTEMATLGQAAVPEPLTLTALLAGLGGLGAYLRRRAAA